jgi:hypothetical protein
MNLDAVERRLGAAIAEAVNVRLDRGIGFLRVPAVVSPLPVRGIIHLVSERHGARFAVFDGEAPSDTGAVAVTDEVAVAIDWRNDADVNEALVILGDLERDRAAGLSEIATFSADEVRATLFKQLVTECQAMDPPTLLLDLMRALGGMRALTDLRACADYCEHLLPIDAGLVDRARSELWRLRLLPDTQTTDFDQRVLRRNSETVVRLLSLDSTSLQRLMQHVADLGPDRYEAVRRFASSGEAKELEGLEFARVLAALKAVSSRNGTGGGGGAGVEEAPHPTLARIAADAGIDENDFLEQVESLPDSGSSDRTVSIGEDTFDWTITNVDSFQDLLQDPAGEIGYAETVGSIERIPDEVPLATPGSGSTEWSEFDDVAAKLELLADRAKIEQRSAELLREILQLRRDLSPYLPSLLDEGVRLFIGAPALRAKASRLVRAWVELWESLEELRSALSEADRGYVLELAEGLSAGDLRVVIHGADVSAHVLPLHPIVLEPRVRAAELLGANPDLPGDIFDLVIESLDPALPSLAVRFGGSSVALGYAGVRNGLLYYAREPHHVDATDVPQTLKQIVGRFISVHPYAELSLSLGLVSPPARVAKALMRWLGDAQIQRARVDVYASPDLVDEIRGALDDAMEEMVSGEVENAGARFGYSVIRLERLTELPKAIDASEGPPHILMFFDLAEVEQSGLGVAANSPSMGTLVSEWEFSTNPLAGSRPVIRPRSGSSDLAGLVNAQAGLFGSSVPAQERSPLLSEGAEALLAEVADRATWIGTCEGMAAFVPAPRIGYLDLLGRLGGTSHVAFLYSQQASLLLEPILRYLQRSTWLHPDRGALAEFLLGTVRRAVPEGLLGFFKAKGNLSSEAVLGRLGFAAVLAYLEDERPGRLVVSLDTDGARRWLGLRGGPEMRADLLAIDLGPDACHVEAIEIKSRTEGVQWGMQPPDWLRHAVGQVQEMYRLLGQMFEEAPGDALTPSRREILKRQVFLEALQQWEGLRGTDTAQYEQRIANLNALFDLVTPVSLSRRVFIVSTKSTDEAQSRELGDPPTSVTTLGVDWFKEALSEKPGAEVEIPLEVLDEFVELLDDIEETRGEPAAEVDGHQPPEVTAVTASPSGEAVSVETAADDEGPPAPEIAHPKEEVAGHSEVGTSTLGTATAYIARRLRDALVARKVQFTAIEDDAIVMGPSVVQIPFSLQAGTRLAALEAQEGDLARDLGVESVRISNWLGRPGYAVAELPRPDRAYPDVASLQRPSDIGYPTVALGAQITFEPLWVALDALPHLLVGGTTGSGKSVFLRSLLWQFTHLYMPSDLDLVVIDAKGMSDYLDFSRAPHIKSGDDFHLGVDGALDLLGEIVETRLPARTRAFSSYARKALDREAPRHLTNLREVLADAARYGEEAPVRPVVVVIDEFAELVLASTDRRRFETLVTRFNQTARAVGGHLIAATQRPSTDVVTGLMKSNFARLALRTQGKVDSRVILDENGAEALLGKGDLLYRSAEQGTMRLQGYSAVGPYSFPS